MCIRHTVASRSGRWTPREDALGFPTACTWALPPALLGALSSSCAWGMAFCPALLAVHLCQHFTSVFHLEFVSFCVAGSVIFVSRNRSCLLSARKVRPLCLSPKCGVCPTLLGHFCVQPDASYLKTDDRLQVSCME